MRPRLPPVSLRGNRGAPPLSSLRGSPIHPYRQPPATQFIHAAKPSPAPSACLPLHSIPARGRRYRPGRTACQ